VLVHNVPYFITCQVQRQTSVPPVRVVAPAVLHALDAIRSRWGAELHGYVVMPDHWHSLITTHPPHGISRVMGSVKTRSAMAIRRCTGTEGPLWQRRFYDHVCRNSDDFEETLAYIHYNPVKAGLVESQEQWMWSSWYGYADGSEPPIMVDPIGGPFEAGWVEWSRHSAPRRRR
jgi:putative transposase